MAEVTSTVHLKVADEVWIVTALLHRAHPERSDFAVQEIMEQAQKAGIAGPLRPGFYVHTIQHCVANRAPNPGRYRMLFETCTGRRRLFRHGDPYDPQREGGKVVPSGDDVPEQFLGLLDWYREWSALAARNAVDSDPLLQLRGSGRQLWAKEHADDYVRRLREGWE